MGSKAEMLARLSALRQHRWGARGASVPAATQADPPAGHAPREADQTTDALPDDQAARVPIPAPSDHELLERAFAARAALDLRALMRQNWKCVGSADREFALHKRASRLSPSGGGRRGGQEKKVEVMCSGDVAASAEEVVAVLHAASEKAFEARMRALYGKEFIFGSVERTVTTERRQVLGGGKRGPQPHVAVKTSSFVASDVFAKNEQWCFLELFLKHRREEGEGADSTPAAVADASDGDCGGFTLSMSSLLPHETLRGRLPASRVRQLHNLTASYFVHKLGTDYRAGVRVHFYGAIDGGLDADSPFDTGEAADEVARRRGSARLQMLARGASKLPELIRRRRLGVQVLADQSAFDAKNTRCTCCTRRFFALVSKKTRCYLCGFYVCETCSLREKLEMCNGHLAAIIVCRRCLDGVNACNYSQLEPSDDESFVPRIIPDPPSPHSRSNSRQSLGIRYSTTLSSNSATVSAQETSTTTLRAEQDAFISPCPIHAASEPDQDLENELKSSASSTSLASTCSCRSTASSACSGSSKLLIDQLAVEIACDESSASRKAAAMTILGYLLDVSASETTSTATPADVSSLSIQHSIDSIRQTRLHLTALVNRAFDVSSYPADVDACELANARERAYPVVVARSIDKSDAVSYPVPSNEAKRLDAISRFGVDLLSDVEELNAVCALAAAEMDCPHGIVTLIERETVRILAANSRENWDIGCHNVREQTFCQHFVMDDRPLLVRHPEADVRFYNLDPVVQKGIRFYAGFPVRAADGTVVGVLCCLDARPREMTRSQYWRLTKLAETASRVVQAKSTLAAAAAGMSVESSVGAVCA